MVIEENDNLKRKRKVLFYGTFPDQNTGYSRVANIISNHLASQDNLDVFYYGISNFVSEENKVKRFIHPNIKFVDAYQLELQAGNDELYGVNFFCDCIKEIKPDIVFIYNDIIVVNRLFNQYLRVFGPGKPKDFKTYVYLDLVYDYERNDLIQNIFNYAEKVFTFTEYWKKQLQTLSPHNSHNIFELEHGIDANIVMMDTQECKKLFNLLPGDFAILNANRNAYRKAWDITIGSFILFLKKNNFDPKLKLMIKAPRQNKTGFNLIDVIRTFSLVYDADFNVLTTNHIFIIEEILSDKNMNKLYNACDIGINTTTGEGFGLCNIEHASRIKPQVVTKVGGLIDIFDGLSDITHVEPTHLMYANNLLDDHNGVMHMCSHESFADKIDFVYKNYETCLEKYNEKVPQILEKYNWDRILKTLNPHFNY